MGWRAPTQCGDRPPRIASERALRLFTAQSRRCTGARGDYEAIFGALPPLDATARFPALAAATTGCVIGQDSTT